VKSCGLNWHNRRLIHRKKRNLQVVQVSVTAQKHSHQHGLRNVNSMISFRNDGLSTETAFALSTTTILFYKKEDKKTVKVGARNKNLVRHRCSFLGSDQVRFGPCSLKATPQLMSAKPTGQSPTRNNVSFEIKSAQLSLVAVLLKNSQWDAVVIDLLKQFGDQGENPEFFDHDPVVLDFSGLERDTAWTAIDGLLKALRSCRLVPLAFRGQPEAWTAALLQNELVLAPQEALSVSKPLRKLVSKPETPPQVVREVPGPPTLVIDKPVRSGQKIYARGADLVVLAMVNQGAELVADGNIHVYAPLRGKAMAGARGNTAARIFSLCLEPELISIAGVYRTSESALPTDVAGKPAQVRLFSEDGQDRLLIEPLKN
jgi:septum site-determining protein MinC